MRLGFTGDVSLHGDVPDDALAQVARRLDCRLVVNYESVLIDSPPPPTAVRDKISLWSPADRFPMLAALNPTAVCLANNHIGDYGDDAARRTLETSAQSWPTFGVGLAAEPFHRCLVAEDNQRIALVAYCQPDTAPLPTTATTVGPRAFDSTTWKDDLTWAKSEADHLVVMMHWGDVHSHCPRPDQVELARALADDGAGLIIGSHSHTVQGYEIRHDVPIFYSLGNCLFPDVLVDVNGRTIRRPNLRRNRWGLLPVFDIEPSRIALSRLSIVRNTNGKPRLTESAWSARRLRRFCKWVRLPDLAGRSESIRRRERWWKRVEESWLRRRDRWLSRPTRSWIRSMDAASANGGAP